MAVTQRTAAMFMPCLPCADAGDAAASGRLFTDAGVVASLDALGVRWPFAGVPARRGSAPLAGVPTLDAILAPDLGSIWFVTESIDSWSLERATVSSVVCERQPVRFVASSFVCALGFVAATSAASAGCVRLAVVPPPTPAPRGVSTVMRLSVHSCLFNQRAFSTVAQWWRQR